MPSSKEEILNLLEKRDYDALSKITMADKNIIRKLISLSYDKKNRNSWRAIEALGIITKDLAVADSAYVRNIVGRLLWMIRDESGGIGWSAPEILGEIVRNNPVLCADVAPIIVSFHEEEMLTSGVLWALGRMGKINHETIEYALPVLVSCLSSTDNVNRGYAVIALGEMGNKESAIELRKLEKDVSLVKIYEDGELKEISIGTLASRALNKITSQK